MNIIHNKSELEFILPLDNGDKALISYSWVGDKKMSLNHSEVPMSLRGQGIGKDLVLKTFEKLSEEGYKAIARCSYIRAVAKRSEKWNTIIEH